MAVQRMAHKAAAHISAISAAASATRFGSESRKSDGEIVGDGCGWPP
jgi:hypothetical protein